MAKSKKDKAGAVEEVWVEESYPEGRVAAHVRMRRDAQSGALSYTASAIRTLDRLRAVLQDIRPASLPGHIRTLREAFGLTQQEFARRLSVSSQTVSRWERGESRPGKHGVRRLRRLQAEARRSGIAARPVKPAKQRIKAKLLTLTSR